MDHCRSSRYFQDIHELLIDQLANEFAKYEYYQDEADKVGYVNEYDKNGGLSIQVNGYQSIQDKALTNIKNLAPKFGLTMADMKNIFTASELNPKSNANELDKYT
jgi:hypothetical protein